MTKYKQIIIEPFDDYEAEVIQRMAFSLNYHWAGGNLTGVRLNIQPGWGFMFDPNTYKIRIESLLKNDFHRVTSQKELLEELKNPVTVHPTFTSKDQEVTMEILKDGAMFYRPTSGTQLFVPQDLINKVSGDRPLPLVSFLYPDSQQNYSVLIRYVRVIKFDKDFLCGLEESRGETTHTTPIFKKYDNMKISNLYLQEFIQHPQN
jgi:hypothetical protein